LAFNLDFFEAGFLPRALPLTAFFGTSFFDLTAIFLFRADFLAVAVLLRGFAFLTLTDFTRFFAKPLILLAAVAFLRVLLPDLDFVAFTVTLPLAFVLVLKLFESASLIRASCSSSLSICFYNRLAI